MSTEQEKKRERLAKLYDEATRTDAERSRVPWSKMHPDHKESAFYVANHILANGGDVILPPEPEWKPEQHARVVLDGSWVLGERHPANTGWLIPGDNGLFHDDEVTDVEPVAVLTAEDVRGVVARVAQRMVASGISDGLWTQVVGEAVEDEFREWGLDL